MLEEKSKVESRDRCAAEVEIEVEAKANVGE
jgi:hypothetical protein